MDLALTQPTPGGEDRAATIRSLSLRVLEAVRNQLLFDHRYLEQALFRLTLAPGDLSIFGTDGRVLQFAPVPLLRTYAEGARTLERLYLHTVLHCLYLHPFFAGNRDPACWNLAADLAVADVAERLEMPFSEEPEEADRARRILRELEREVGAMSAQNLYTLLLRKTPAECQALAALFQRDDHLLWYPQNGGQTQRRQAPQTSEPEEGTGAAGQAQAQEQAQGRGTDREGGGNQGNMENGANGAAPWRDAAGMESWKTAAEAVSVALAEAKSRGRMQGDTAGNLIKTLEYVTRENYDYGWFLRHFARFEERMRLDPDTFDYIYYTYGLRLYGNVPLIESLEYREERLVRNFVIALDTSASCDGALVRRFLEKTADILEDTERFSRKVNLHILQCDAEIQDDLRLEDVREFRRYAGAFRLKGFGGTDFRPVFAYVEKLRQEELLDRIDGLLYFTDGYGYFPAKPPKYRTAFIFVNRDDNVRVPPWAMRVYLDAEHLER